MNVVVLGLSITSSWGNGHATTYRSLVRGLAALGHRVVFLERDKPWYASNRDLPKPDGCRTVLYDSLDALRDEHTALVREADAVIVGSYVPEGVQVADFALRTAQGVVAFYDIDTPVTLAKLDRGDEEYLARADVPRFDMYLSFTGGPTLDRLERDLGAKRARALYCSVDPDRYGPVDVPPRWDLGYLGTYSADRQPPLERLLLDPARRLKQRRFVVGGPSYPAEIAWPPNVERVNHVAPGDHPAFYGAQRFTLNVTRADMRAAGWSPSVRLFEAAACGVPLVSDTWPGIEELLEPDTEILLARTADDVVTALCDLTEEERMAIGNRARARVLRSHTGVQRARELVEHLEEASQSANAVPRRASRVDVGVVGAGYVGLVAGAGFAELGHRVVCADIDADRVAKLNEGVIPIVEPGLDELIEAHRERLSFTSDLAGTIARSEAVFVAVGTPCRSDGAADLSAVFAVAEAVADHAAREMVLVLKSTVPVGTNARVRAIVRRARHPVHVVSNPEFLKEGAAVPDFRDPDRVVVGLDLDDGFARRTMERLYAPIGAEILWMDPASAELTKYVSNTMLAMRISFMNEVAALCEAVGADVDRVREGVGSDTRIGPAFLYAGPGYGGSCFPKDVKALVSTGHEHGVGLELASATHRVNERQKGVLLRKLRSELGHDLRGRRIAVWGLAFKPDTDDVRESPALPLIEGLLSEGAMVVAHDPAAAAAARALFGERVEVADEPYVAANDADALVLVTDWDDYREPDLARLARAMRGDVLVDGRNAWRDVDPEAHRFRILGIGRGR